MDFYALLCLILGIPIGLFLHRLITNNFEIYYWGLGAVWGLFWGCLVVGAVVMFLLLELLRGLAIPIGILFLILWLANRKKKGSEEDEEDDDDEDEDEEK